MIHIPHTHSFLSHHHFITGRRIFRRFFFILLKHLDAYKGAAAKDANLQQEMQQFISGLLGSMTWWVTRDIVIKADDSIVFINLTRAVVFTSVVMWVHPNLALLKWLL